MSKIMPFLLLSLSLSFALSGCAGIHNKEFSDTGQPTKDCMAFYFAGMGSSSAKEISACGGTGASQNAQTDQAIKEMVPVAVEAVKEYLKLP